MRIGNLVIALFIIMVIALFSGIYMNLTGFFSSVMSTTPDLSLAGEQGTTTTTTVNGDSGGDEVNDPLNNIPGTTTTTVKVTFYPEFHPITGFGTLGGQTGSIPEFPSMVIPVLLTLISLVFFSRKFF